MSVLKLAPPLRKPVIYYTKPPNSNFDFIEKNFGFSPPLYRILSQVRTSNFSTLVLEDIDSVGFSQEDDSELRDAGYVLSTSPLKRLSFFKSKIRSIRHLKRQKSSNLLGYAIMKQVPLKDKSGGFRWIVFESVVTNSRHVNNYIPRKKQYAINIGNNILTLSGVLYCQQNGINNVCAHVALRTAISLMLESGDISYREINQILKNEGMPHYPTDPLARTQILRILDKLGIKWSKETYFSDEELKRLGEKGPTIPYQTYLYSSIESGYPALLAFSVPNRDEGHVIPCFGHTFNEDTWVPRAETSYFNIGKISYLHSDSWLSTYICHDDNFGSNYCLPKQYISNHNSILVIALRPNEISYDAIFANAITLDYLYTSLANELQVISTDNIWAKRLLAAIRGTNKGWFVLRAMQVNSRQYIQHLRSLRAWGKRKVKIPEYRINSLERNLKNDLWIVEISLPELFPANRRKLGEVVFNPNISTVTKDLSSFLFARILDKFYFLKKFDQDQLEVTKYDAGISSHTELFSFASLKTSRLSKLLSVLKERSFWKVSNN
ncbi:MAG: hypothetical protein WC578_06285 [Candidatus Omnitrophota bacterium]|jgi:hypothetical protein